MSVARSLGAGLWVAALGCSACLGCARAHYVMRNQDSGIIAIPRDTPALRAEAEKLMHKHMPQGYVIDEVREVAVGPPYRTVMQVGIVREVQWHQDHEYMLTYHAAHGIPAGPPIQAAPAAVRVAPAPAPAAPPPVQQAGGLPPQPIPVGN